VDGVRWFLATGCPAAMLKGETRGRRLDRLSGPVLSVSRDCQDVWLVRISYSFDSIRELNLQ
jgi:hypothetical protein